VQDQVATQRHLPLPDLLLDIFQGQALFDEIESRPLREVQIATTVLDMVGNPPGQRRHVAVPRPTCFMGVAVVTCSTQNRLDLTRRIDIPLDRRVDAIHRNELQRQKNDTQPQDDPSQQKTPA